MKLKRANAIDNRPDAATIARFMKHVDVQASGVWAWTGYRSPKGYGQFKWRGKAHWAHRVSYLIFNGPLTAGQDVGHLPPPGEKDPLPWDVSPDRLELQGVSANVAEGNRRRAKEEPAPF